MRYAAFKTILHFISQQPQLPKKKKKKLLNEVDLSWLLEKNLVQQFVWLGLELGTTREILLAFILTITWSLPNEWTVKTIKKRFELTVPVLFSQ